MIAKSNEDDHLDGCDVDMTAEDQITADEDIDALTMFADCWDDPAAVEQRVRELVDWTEATGG